MNAIPLQCSPAPLLASNLSKRYGKRTILEGIHLELEAGSVLGLIGRNGAGKTTLLRCLLGLQLPDGGSSLVMGQTALHLDDHIKDRLAYVPQQPEAFAWMRVDAMLDLVGRLYRRWDRAWVKTMLVKWEIDPTQMLAKLSPGERQRVALIRALAAQPDLLVLDEPAAALDPIARRELLREIVARAADAGTSVLFSTHIVSDLERVASHVAFLHHGRLLLHSSLDETKERIGRVILPHSAGQPPGTVAGEMSRRYLDDGRLALVLQRVDDSWPALTQTPDAQFAALGLEDLFIEVAR
ncbi:MAG: ABC transporter ATP-binding protein [Xanthomonadaceae bacterium]|nr:ABC transporter ATP-binding protein [Xanthomonadaceae bacterium]MDZ4116552.1 ABC transporter ATP-binding protein [Xanthomonadaceae bacterium]